MKTIKNAFNAYKKHPEVILFFLLLYVVLYLFSFFKMPASQSAFTDYLYLIVPYLILIFISAFFLSLIISACHLSLKDKFSIKQVIKSSKFTFGNFLLSLMLVIINILFLLIANYSKVLFSSLPFITQAYIQTGIYFFGFLLISVFFIFQFFFYTIKNQSIFKSIKNSFVLGKRNYLKILLVPLSYVALTFLISLIPYELVKQVIYFLIIYPLLSLILTSLFENVSNK